jgi:hypothetical protein
MSSRTEEYKLEHVANNNTKVEDTETTQPNKNIVTPTKKCFELGTSPPVDIPCAPKQEKNQTNSKNGFFNWWGVTKNKTYENDYLNPLTEDNRDSSIDNMSPESNPSSDEVFKMDDISLENKPDEQTHENTLETKDEDTPGEESESSEESESDEENTDFSEYEGSLDKFEEELAYYKYGTFPYMGDFIVRWHDGNRYEGMVRYMHDCNDSFLNGTMSTYRNNKDLLAVVGFFSILTCFGILENFIFGYISYIALASSLPVRPCITHKC